MRAVRVYQVELRAHDPLAAETFYHAYSNLYIFGTTPKSLDRQHLN